MKKTIILLLIFAFTLTFCACQAGSSAKPPVAEKDESKVVYDMNYIAEDGGVSKDWICPENSIYRFLTESNFEGSSVPSQTEPSGEPVPGDLPPADSVKQDERNIKNTDITLSFSTK